MPLEPMPIRLYVPEPFVEMVNVAPDPLPLVLDCNTPEKVDAPVAEPFVVAALIPDAAVPAADAVMAPETGEFPDAEATVTLPVKS